MRLALPGIRPASVRVRRSRNSIWALALRSSSRARRGRAQFQAEQHLLALAALVRPGHLTGLFAGSFAGRLTDLGARPPIRHW
jgi:hypothetical protein